MFRVVLLIWCLHRASSVCVEPAVCTDNSEVQDEIVNVHNNFRRIVSPSATNMVMMKYNESLAKSAQSWVDNCVLEHGPPSTRMLGDYELGENLFYSSPDPKSWTEVITAWHSEVSHYEFPIGSIDGHSIGHYTQVVWYTSYLVGCGVSQCENGIHYYGCHYYRAGNLRRHPPYTAGDSGAECSSGTEDGLCSLTDVCPEVDLNPWCGFSISRVGCDNEWVMENCPASCHCLNKIIPPV